MSKWFNDAIANLETFVNNGGKGKDPFALVYESRRAEYSLFSKQMSDEQIEKLRRYIFPYSKLPSAPSDKPINVYNLIAGEWRAAQTQATMQSPADRRINLMSLPDSQASDVSAALDYAQDYWKSYKWADETLAYRKHVVKNFSRMMNYFYEECCQEIRACIPKTRLEVDKDFYEAKRAADHLEGSAERVMSGTRLPSMIEGHSYWKNPYIPAGISAIFTPMNFIYGIPVIHLVGCYLTGSPFIFKGHPFAGLANTSMIRMLIAAGADPHTVQKIEGFGKGIESLVSDKRVAVVCLTGSDATAERMQSLRGLKPVKFEGGGCNWAFVDEGFSDEELNRIAVRLTYSKLGFSSHKCTTLHGISASPAVLAKLMPMVSKEMDTWRLGNPAATEDTKVVGPCVVHKAQTAQDIMEAAAKAGATVFRKGGKVKGEWGDHAEVIAPIILTNVKPGMNVTVNWDGRGEKTSDLTTTEFFMPILLGMEVKNFSEFLDFCMFHNTHDLAVSIWSKNARVLDRGRKILAGMLKENDGTDSALEWEEFGASCVGCSGNMGVGDPEATFQIYSRRQKGRHVLV